MEVEIDWCGECSMLGSRAVAILAGEIIPEHGDPEAIKAKLRRQCAKLLGRGMRSEPCKAASPRAIAKRPAKPVSLTYGVGDALKDLLASLGITRTGCEGCTNRRATMNAWGPQGCRENVDVIAGWLKESARSSRRDEKLRAAWSALKAGVVINPLDPFRSLALRAIEMSEAVQEEIECGVCDGFNFVFEHYAPEDVVRIGGEDLFSALDHEDMAKALASIIDGRELTDDESAAFWREWSDLPECQSKLTSRHFLAGFIKGVVEAGEAAARFLSARKGA